MNITLKTTLMLALMAGMSACSSDQGSSAVNREDTPAVSSQQESPTPKIPSFVEGFDLTYGNDTLQWYSMDTSRVIFYVNSPEREDFRANIYTPDGDHVKTIYETALKTGENEISFSPDILKSGTYRWVLTKNIYADTVQMCLFDVRDI